MGSEVQHRAITLLYRAGKEGVWDGNQVAYIAEHVLGIAEHKMRPPADEREVEISEHQRVCGVSISTSCEDSNSMRGWPWHSPNDANLLDVKRDADNIWDFYEDVFR